MPIAMKTGYAESYSTTKSRSQIIVVVREDMTISCFSSKLELLWEKSISHRIHDMDSSVMDRFKVQDLSLFISPVSIKANHTGIIVLGCSLGPIDPRDSKSSSLAKKVEVESGIQSSNSSDHSANHIDETAALEHYGFYALDAHDGELLWKHDGSEVSGEQFTKSLPQHAYRLDKDLFKRQLHHAAGLSEWLVFRQSLIAELPHSWTRREDGGSRLAHFMRRNMGTGAVNQSPKKVKSHARVTDIHQQKRKRRTGNAITGKGRFLGVDAPPLAASALLPHDASEHTEHPNVIVAHTRRGLEAVSLLSGLPVTSLALSERNTYADVNGDGVVDTLIPLESEEALTEHIRYFASKDDELYHCTFIALSGLPPHGQLFNGTICARRPSLNEPIIRHSVQHPNVISAAVPVLLPHVGMGPRADDGRTNRMMDIIYAVDTGIVSCFSGDGEYMWQVMDAPRWDRLAAAEGSSFAGITAFDWDAERVEETGGHFSKHAQLLVIGDVKMTLISRDGSFLASADIPKPATAKVTLGDFNSDGLTDVIVVTDGAVLGYKLEVAPSPNGLLYAFCILGLISLVVFVSNLRVHNVSDKRVNVLTLIRSTDEYHMD